MAEELTDETLDRMLRGIDPDWELREATPAESGFSSVYHLVVETANSTRECFLKATPDDDRGVPAEVRLLALLRDQTAIPVPRVVGAVDDHPDLPSPFSLTSPMPGSDVPYEQVGWVSDSVLRTTARQLGAHLGQLHGIDAVDAYGLVGAADSPKLAGGRPGGTVDELAVEGGSGTWAAFLRRWVDRELERHESSRFAELTPALEDWCDDRLEALTGPFAPVLGRNDHGFHNLLLDTETGEITAMLDWAYTLAVTPAFDFHYAAYLFSGAFLAGISEVPDRRDLVREAMLEGYRSTAPELVEAVSGHRPLYELLATMRIMNDFDQLAPKLPEGSVGEVVDGIRADVRETLERK